MYFDLHTHSFQNHNTNNLSVINIFPNKKDMCTLSPANYYSICLHPKHINKNNLSESMAIMEKYASNKNIIAIGEIGLDKNYPDFQKQNDIFEQLLKLSEKFNKPVIIHCVKSFSEILFYRKRYRKTPWLIHGFRGKPVLCSQLNSSDIYISFDRHILNPTVSLLASIENIPIDKTLLETDESSESIENIYKAFAKIKKISVKKLCTNISKTVQNIFGENIVL